jgi:hypothetical protein
LRARRKHGAYVDPDFDTVPVTARALLSPFDSLIWRRVRAGRLYGYRHVFGLYVLARSGATATACRRCCPATRPADSRRDPLARTPPLRAGARTG